MGIVASDRSGHSQAVKSRKFFLVNIALRKARRIRRRLRTIDWGRRQGNTERRLYSKTPLSK
ncbi:hypothetical protein M407DRAFT_169146 [Tulasnella calospora MUT 4182]|uniref:Uncharacterized protein n=1 Tax=Tulasnella calospora MUT 4182 TaxID=1051891 RepID=A0A0C3K8A7_9AGAM|nr:hypothetical protein M407DRAFT_169146 [Tulasnella calospora MUT 4182]